MRKRKTPLFVPVLWFVTAFLWGVTFTTNLTRGSMPAWSIALQGVTAAVSLAAASASFKRYLDGKSKK